jgi:ABC-type oligopeptide transport system substrate-binding subunit/DNA-binding SARP family transcriptional activator
MLEVRLLGKFEICVDGRPVEVPLRAARSLLAYLLLNAGTDQRREQVAGLIWPDMTDAKAKDNLRHTLWVIRKALGNRDYLLANDLSVSFNATLDYWLDTALLNRKTTDDISADDLLATVSVYGGGLLPGFYDDWIVLERERLQAVFERKMALLLDKLVEAQRWPEVLEWGERWIALGQVPEPAYRALMSAHAGLEDNASVATVYQRCIEALKNELGVEPAAQTRALYERLQREAKKQVNQAAVEVKVARYNLPARSSRFIGRERELAEARRLWQQAMQGDGHVLLISGEPGVGKTRLAHELLTHAQATGAAVLLGECFAEGSAPYAPLAQMIASTDLSGLPASIVADLLTIAPALRAAYPNIPPNLLLEPLAERQRILDNVAAFLATLSERAPVLLFVDDAQWADSGTLFLLHHLARRARTLRVLIVLTYREVELSEARPLHEMLLDLNRERLATRLKLSRFDREQTCDLLAALFQEEITPEFLDGIYNETDGNPFFVEEVCKALIESGKLTREDGRWRRPGMDQIDIPQSVRVAIELRVAKLPAFTQDAIRAAAILGREFEFEVLQAMDGLGEDALIDALEIAERAQLIGEIKRSGATSFAFVHALIPLTLHEGLSILRRQRLHRRAAQAIEQVHANQLSSGDFAAPLGRHYAEAGDREKAIEHFLRAAERARSVYAYQEAIEHYQQALAFLKEQGTPELTRAARTAMTLGGLYHTVFDFERSQQAYQEGFALWQRVEEEPRKITLPPAPHALRLYHADIQTLDFTLTNHIDINAIAIQLFSGLVDLTLDFEVVPMLAYRWEILDSGRRYVFHLRRDARWSDGQSVTAHDFDCAWRRTLDPATRSPNAEYLYPIKNARAVHLDGASLESLGIRLPDDFTLVVDLEEPTNYFLQLLRMTAMFAIPRHIVKAYGAAWCETEHLVTNGAFRLTEWIRGDKLILTRNPDYWGRFSGNLARVELTLVAHKKITLDKYDTGEHGIGVLLDEDMIPLARQQHPSEIINLPMAHTLWIGFDTARPPFDDVRVRQALAHAVDRITLCEIVLRNSAAPATGGITSPGLPGYTEHSGLAYDPEQARRLLAEAGYPQGRGFPAIDAWAPSYFHDRVCRYLETQWWENLGLTITWQMFEPSDYFERLARHTPQLFRYGWVADYPDPDNFLRIGLNRQPAHWHNEQYEHLLDTARRVSDPAERLKFYQAADRLLMQEAIIMPLLHNQWYFLIKPWVKRYPISAINAYHWKDVIIEPH